MDILELPKTILPEGDVNSINELLKQLTSNARNYNRYDIKRIARQRNVFIHIAVSRPDRKIIGMATLRINDGLTLARNFKDAEIHDVVVDQNYRGQGIGEKLIHSLMSKARHFNVKYVSLTSNPKRLSAIKMYEKMGFERIGEIKDRGKITNSFRLYLEPKA